MRFERAAVVASASVGLVDFDPFAQFGGDATARTSRLAPVLPIAAALARRTHAARVSATGWCQWIAPDQSTFTGAIAASPRSATARGRADGRDGFAGSLQRLQKKTLGFIPPRTRR